MVDKIRIDLLLVQKGLIESRSSAQRLIMAGKVRVDGQMIFKPAQQITANSSISIEEGPPFVSRGGEKLEAALDSFEVLIEGLICADVGSSTGGFTDCLLQRGAERVYAIDVGYGQLHWKMRNDPRVVAMERTNARYLETLDDVIDLVTIDVSFISLKIILRAAIKWIARKGRIIALIKPQFEAGREVVGRGGVVRDGTIHSEVITDVLDAARALDLHPFGLIRSPLKGPKGNIEFLVGLERIQRSFDLTARIESVIEVG